ncbi:MAG: hypothetical protein LBU60_00290 [Clostridiales bacterium]|jgi:phosphatidylglycerophosphate synthase|nr:hypothetical protein [Clostridiales bacterium]
MALTKKPNLIVRYFTPFGLKQVADVLMVVATIVAIVGLSTSNEQVLIVGFVFYMLASAIAVLMCLRVLKSGINKRAPAYKSAYLNIIIMSVVLVVSIFALIRGMGWINIF